MAARAATPAPTTVTRHRPIQTPLLRRAGGCVIAPAAKFSVECVAGGIIEIGTGVGKLAPGSTGPDVVLLRRRLSITDDLAADQIAPSTARGNQPRTIHDG